MNYSYGECCCPVLYGEAFVASATGVFGEVALERMSLSAHDGYSQERLGNRWRAVASSMSLAAGGSGAIPTFGAVVRTRLAETGNTVWMVSHSNDFIGAVNVTDINSPAMVGVYEMANGGAGVEKLPPSTFPVTEPGGYDMIALFEMDGGVCCRSVWGDDWLVYCYRDYRLPATSPYWDIPKIYFADPQGHVWRDDAYFDFTGDWVPLGLCRSSWPARVVGCKLDVTRDGDDDITSVTLSVGDAELPAAAPTSYPQPISPSFATAFTRTYTNTETDPQEKPSAGVVIYRLARMAVVGDYDNSGVWTIFAADSGSTGGSYGLLNDWTWRWNYSASIGGQTSATISQPATGVGGPGVNYNLFDGVATPALEVHSSGGGVVGVLSNGDAYLGGTLISAPFSNGPRTYRQGGLHALTGSGLTNDIGTLAKDGTRARFVAAAESAGGGKGSVRMYYYDHEQKLDSSALDLAASWQLMAGLGSASASGYELYQTPLDGLGGAEWYLMPGYQVSAGQASEKLPRSPLGSSYFALADVSNRSDDDYVPDHTHVRRGAP